MPTRKNLVSLKAHFFTTDVEEPAATLTFHGFDGTYEDGCAQVEQLLVAQGNCIIWDEEPIKTSTLHQTPRHLRHRVCIVKSAITMVTIQLIEPVEQPNEN